MSIEEELKTAAGDVIYKVVRTSVASVPVAGNILSELFTTLIAEPSGKRRDKILIKIDNRLMELSNKVESFNIESLAGNEVFLSTVSQAFQIAMRTHQQEKIEALLNAIINSITENIEDNLQHMFLMFIDSFTEWHLRILFLLDNPVQVLQDKGLDTNFVMGSLSIVFRTAYPELIGREEFYKQIMKDLYSRGLVSTKDEALNTTMSGSGMLASRATEMGKQFIKFIKRN
jgi:hypothetical protein